MVLRLAWPLPFDTLSLALTGEQSLDIFRGRRSAKSLHNQLAHRLSSV